MATPIIAHTPRYLLRRSLALHLLRKMPRGRFLEIGCGRGDLLPYLVNAGHQGIGLEISESAREVASSHIGRFPQQLGLVSDPEAIRGELFDYVIALEVIEHIPDDAAAISEWCDWIRPGGRLILSVPAHMSKWTAADDHGGHIRRYERRDLETLIGNVGLEIEYLWSYGFPLTSVTVPIRRLLYSKSVPDGTKASRTLQSSFDSTRVFGRGGVAVAAAGNIIGTIFHVLQLPFRSTDWGDGYMVCARLQ